jgi:hypothetical protein
LLESCRKNQRLLVIGGLQGIGDILTVAKILTEIEWNPLAVIPAATFMEEKAFLRGHETEKPPSRSPKTV